MAARLAIASDIDAGGAERHGGPFVAIRPDNAVRSDTADRGVRRLGAGA